MLIQEIVGRFRLHESVELSSTLRSIASEIGNPITAVYDKLKDSAQKWSESHDSMDNFSFIEKGISSKWYNDQGENLVSELYHLADQAPSQAASSLRRFLRDEKSTDFKTLARNVTPILVQIGKDADYEHLVRNAIAWRKQEKEYSDMLEQLATYAASSHKRAKSRPASAAAMADTRGEKIDQAAAERKALKAKQQVQIEQLVNSILAQLPKGIAGEIRNAIAKDPNKLHALQGELAKRKISI